MKRSSLLLYPVAVLMIAFTCAFIQANDVCDSKALKDAAKAALDPFKYDSGKVTRLYYKKKDQVKEIEVPVFVGEKYRFVFNSEAVTRNVQVTIYNKDKEAKSRKELFSFSCSDKSEKIHTWEPTGRSLKYYVDYSIPTVSDSLPPSECVVLMLGYK